MFFFQFFCKFCSISVDLYFIKNSINVIIKVFLYFLLAFSVNLSFQLVLQGFLKLVLHVLLYHKQNFGVFLWTFSNSSWFISPYSFIAYSSIFFLEMLIFTYIKNCLFVVYLLTFFGVWSQNKCSFHLLSWSPSCNSNENLPLFLAPLKKT